MSLYTTKRQLVVGDWSFDGHGRCDHIDVEITTTVPENIEDKESFIDDKIGSMIDTARDKYNINFDVLCAFAPEITEKQKEYIDKLGVKYQKYLLSEDGKRIRVLSPVVYFDLFIDTMKLVDPSVQINASYIPRIYIGGYAILADL